MSKSRVEREIEEILSKYDEEKGEKTRGQREDRQVVDFRPNRTLPPRPGRYSRSTPSFTMPNWKRLSSGQYMLMAFGAALMAMIVGTFSSLLATLFILLAVVLFIVPILLYVQNGTTSGGWSPTTEEKRWRGQVINMHDRTRRDPNDPLEGIKRFFRRR
ncbi:MAG: hypothetical protein M3437_12345 [Chloroflexota bacterium]|nr:hypothetical protein [Chloroflexota bacterium]MDQ5867238.1 hypothetical protein [Chloroflexota bacterium]